MSAPAHGTGRSAMLNAHWDDSERNLYSRKGIGFRATKTTNQSMTSPSTNTVISYDALTAADVNCASFNITTGIFTVPHEGWYNFTGQVSIQADVGGTRRVMITELVTSLELGAFKLHEGNAAQTEQFQCSGRACLLAGQTVALRVFQDSGTPLNITNAVFTGAFEGRGARTATSQGSSL